MWVRIPSSLLLETFCKILRIRSQIVKNGEPYGYNTNGGVLGLWWPQAIRQKLGT